MKYTNSQLKETCAIAWESNFGIRPKNKDIQIIDKNDNRTYIIFTVGNHLYKFYSYTFHDDSIWCGNGTVEKIDEWYKNTSGKLFSITPSPIGLENESVINEKWNPLRGKFELIEKTDSTKNC